MYYFLSCGALILAWGWLLPMHHLPWTTFHNDAWIAGFLLIFSIVTLIKIRSPQPWSYLALFAALLSLVPLFQLAAGQIKFLGTAWISSLYLLGFALSILTATRWQLSRENELVDVLFLGIGTAAIISVGIQLCQWLNVDDGCLCSTEWFLLSTNARISGNLSQPNQQATFLLLGIAACAWGWLRQKLNSVISALAILFFLFGIALTESRTGMLSLGIMLICVWYWRCLWPSRQTPFVATALFLIFTLFLILQPSIHLWLLSSHTSSVVARIKNELRPDLWSTFLNAALERPWLGYGWNQSIIAQVLSANNALTQQGVDVVVSSYAHNLFIDLILWLGIPFGLITSFALAIWFIRTANRVQKSLDASLMLAVVPISVHAMLELPIYYAYLLLPLGLIIGFLEVSIKSRNVFVTTARPVVCILFVCSAAFIVTVRDYFVIEQSYNELRLDAARITRNSVYQAPDVLVLTQLRDLIALARFEPVSNMPQEKIDWVSNITLVYPAQINLIKVATVLALNGQPTQAAHWLKTVCNLHGVKECERGKFYWESLQNQHPQILLIPWPK